MQADIATTLAEIRRRGGLSQQRLAHILGVSYVSINRWERGATAPSPLQAQKIRELGQTLFSNDLWAFQRIQQAALPKASPFASRGIRQPPASPSLFAETQLTRVVRLTGEPLVPLLTRLAPNRFFSPDGQQTLARLLQEHTVPATTAAMPPQGGMAAGKNTYTYDAHTYHTKVPPQGIAELLKHYLPAGGLVLDPFAGSGMTGVASRTLGYDCILNELSPAACFIAREFTTQAESAEFEEAVQAILRETQELRESLYTTTCRECGRPTEILYTVWSYRVMCNACEHEFSLWDVCCSYGKRVRDHKILTEFPCPACGVQLKKSRLRRTIAEPVELGYMCCGSRQQEVTHPLNQADLELVYRLQLVAPLAEGFYPHAALPD
ncbi:MAG TPA: DNA methyltransferase, partial [Ktedonobacterales bacterium]|nr:DNA methyltransferase [Ktedonobacterales bacterium]